MTTAIPATTDMSAKDFQEPLLSALHFLSGGEAAKDIPFKDAYKPVMDQMGIASLDAHGANTDGKAKVAQWIQWAYKNLKRTGQVLDTGRGQWALSATGVTEAKPMIAQTAAPTPAKPASITRSAGVSSPVSAGQVVDAYHSDPYIRALALKATDCSGSYSHKAGTCERCTLQGPCINFLAATMSNLAAVLLREDAQEDARKAQNVANAQAAKDAAERAASGAADPTPVAVAPSVGGPFPWENWETDNVRSLLAKAQSTCPRCLLPVDRGTTALWLRAKELNPGERKKAVLFHSECGPDAK